MAEATTSGRPTRNIDNRGLHSAAHPAKAFASARIPLTAPDRRRREPRSGWPAALSAAPDWKDRDDRCSERCGEAGRPARPCCGRRLGARAQHAAPHHPDDPAPSLAGRPRDRRDARRRDPAADDPAPARPRRRPEPGRDGGRRCRRRRRDRARRDRPAPSRGQRVPRPLHDGAELLRRVGRPSHRLRAAPRILRKDPAPELRLPRPGAFGRPHHHRHARPRGRADVLLDRARAHGAAHGPDRVRRLPAALDRPAARAPRAQLRALRRLALVGHPPAAARRLARAAGAALDPDPGDGGEPRRHPRRARLHRPRARAPEVRRRVEERARARPRAGEDPGRSTPAR